MKKAKVVKKAVKKSEVYGISAGQSFWDEVHRRTKETGQSRSAVIVETCAEQWKLPTLVSAPVGRPRGKVGKK
jgi:hypothetical protein